MNMEYESMDLYNGTDLNIGTYNKVRETVLTARNNTKTQ